jgi:uncharacterized membrane protein HdeD (DUF308 family)
MVPGGRDLTFRITLVVLCFVALVEVGLIVLIDPGVTASSEGVFFGAVVVLIAWLIHDAMRKRSSVPSRTERLLLAVGVVVGGGLIFALGLRRFSTGHQTDAVVKVVLGVVQAAVGMRQLVRTLQRRRLESDVKDDVEHSDAAAGEVKT